MKPGVPSETALRIAGNRVAAARDPVLRTLLSSPDEPYSEWFIRAHSARARFLLRLWLFGPTRRLIQRAGEAALPGAVLHILLRKRHLEDAVRSALAAGIEQVVVFGAGYDPLSLRLHPQFPSARFFEVDHPATQEVKRRALLERDALPPQLTLVPVDFTRESVEEKLRKADGFDPSTRGLFVAEGVLMYLPETEVNALFACVRRNSAPGSRFLFTMLDSAALADPESPASRAGRLSESHGEPLRSSQDRRKLDGFLRKHGFRARSIADHRSLRTAYLKPAGLELPLLEGEFIVEAETA